MFCSHCGKRLEVDAVFCDGCGTPITGATPASSQENVANPAPSDSKPAKRRKRKKSAKPTPWPLRILFLVIAAIMLYQCLAHTAIFLFGKTASPYFTSQSNTGKTDKSYANSYTWFVYYDFSVNDNEYEGHDLVRGSLASPNKGGLMVGYLPILPQVNTLVAGTLRGGEVMKELLITLAGLAGGLFFGYILVKIAIPKKDRSQENDE